MAYNFDGGQTSMMVFDGKVVNKPYKDGAQLQRYRLCGRRRVIADVKTSLPHVSIVCSLMLLVLYIINLFNDAMGFLRGPEFEFCF